MAPLDEENLEQAGNDKPRESAINSKLIQKKNVLRVTSSLWYKWTVSGAGETENTDREVMAKLQEPLRHSRGSKHSGHAQIQPRELGSQGSGV